MELKTVHSLFTDCWKLYKEFCESELNDYDMEKFVECTKELSKRYNNNKFAVELLITVSNEIDRIEREKHKQGVKNGCN